MSTNINISVGDNKLLEQARLQQAASRQAQLEREASQRLEAQATAERTKALAAQGIDANGNPLTGTGFQAPQVERRPAANRLGAGAGMSIGWIFSRLKEQPPIFTGGGLGFYSSSTSRYTVISGTGATKYDFDLKYDHSALWTNAVDGQDLSNGPLNMTPSTFTYTKDAPLKISLGPYNPTFPQNLFPDQGTTRIVSWEIWLPVAKGILLYYVYNKHMTAFQFASTQRWSYFNPANNTTLQFTNLYSIQPPLLNTDITEQCLLVSAASVKSISVPTSFRDKLLAANTSYTLVQETRSLDTGVVEGNQLFGLAVNPYTFTGFRWVATPPSISMNSLFQNRKDNYTVTPPLPGSPDSSAIASGYYITTGGAYKSLVQDPSTDYNSVGAKAPDVTNVNDATGFGVGLTWEDIYDNATKLKHASDKNAIKASDLDFAQNRTARPSDSLTITTPEGGSVTVDWVARVAIGYDWANAKYCKDQLIKLGFTSADLTP